MLNLKYFVEGLSRNIKLKINSMLESDPKWLFWGLAGSQEPQGRSSWSKMVPGHWYNVPHYATALPAGILGFKFPKSAKIWPEMTQK